jgi:fructose PTS system EIIBC or EIIC component
MTGSAIGSVIAMMGGVGDHAPHGGPIVLPVIDNRLIFVIAIVTGSVVVALIINALRKFGVKKAT